MKRYSIIITLLFYCIGLYSQENIEKNKHFDFFPNGRIFSLINLDPLTCKTYGGIHVIYEKGIKKNGVFIPVNLGFSKAFFRYTFDNIKFELGLEAASYTQF